MSITFSPQQQEAIDKILHWRANSPPGSEFRFGGYAGTGKTTIIKEIIRRLGEKGHYPQVAAFTGKAVNVLDRKGVSAMTLHSLLYECNVDPKTGIVTFSKRNSLSTNPYMIIVDEASMVSTELYNDLRSHNKHVMYVGDPGQLEPVGDNPNLMKSCDFTLSEIHRQAKESSILRLAHDIREGGNFPFKHESPDLIIRSKQGIRIPDLAGYDQVIVAKNKTRKQINNQFRLYLERPINDLCVGDKIIVLRNNGHFAVFNGMILFVTKLHDCNDPDYWLVDARDEINRNYSNLPIWKLPFSGQEMPKEVIVPKYYPPKSQTSISGPKPNLVYADFAYAITCHKSQGSEWPNVVLWDEWMPPEIWSMSRWRYTGITRAAQKLLVCK